MCERLPLLSADCFTQCGNKSLTPPFPCFTVQHAVMSWEAFPFFFYEGSSVISGGDQLAEQSARPVLLCDLTARKLFGCLANGECTAST